MSLENKALIQEHIFTGDRILAGSQTDAVLCLKTVNTLMNAVRAEEQARADIVTPAMIQAAQDRVQGPDEVIYASIYRAMRAVVYIAP